MTREELAIQPSDYDFDTSVLGDRKATYAVVAQEMNIGDLNVTLEKTENETFEFSSVISGMISLEENMTFGAGNFEPIAYSMAMAMGPNRMSAEIAFKDGTAVGKSEGGPEGPKDIKDSVGF